jgi:hypothetical protein
MAVRFGVRIVSLGIALFATPWVMSVPEASASCDINCVGTACNCSGTGLCDVNQNQTVPPGGVVDCSGRDIVFGGGAGGITITDGTFMLRANNVTINNSHTIRIDRSSATGPPIGMAMELTGSLTVAGMINADAPGGGASVKVAASQDITFSVGGFAIRASGQSSNSPGGRVYLSGRNVSIAGPVNAKASDNGVAPGGQVTVFATGDVGVSADINVLGRNAPAGTIMLSADGNISTSQALKAEGNGVGADGGLVELTATTIVLGALVTSQGGVGATGGTSQGGAVVVNAGTGGATINANVNATGGELGAGLDGGAIVVDSIGNVTVASGVQLLTRSENNGGDGGDVHVSSRGWLSLNGATIDARGHSAGTNQGTGAAVELEACGLKIASGSLIDARGYNGGAVSLIGREALIVKGAVDARPTSGAAGSIDMFYRLAGTCSGSPPDPPRGCEVQCGPFGKCTNDPNRSCSTNSNCTIGCQTGQCVKKCRHDSSVQCAVNGDCQPCGATNQCAANPDLVGADFKGLAYDIVGDRNLDPCDPEGEGE